MEIGWFCSVCGEQGKLDWDESDLRFLVARICATHDQQGSGAACEATRQKTSVVAGTRWGIHVVFTIQPGWSMQRAFSNEEGPEDAERRGREAALKILRPTDD
jgi:hypothetical protein